jgi:GNAT superfamily N-acetyltransferase
MIHMLEIRRCTISDIESASRIDELKREYIAESTIAGAPQGDPQWDTYRAMEASGFLHCVAAYDGDEIVGFLTVMIALVPHHHRTRPIATTESFFVLPDSRSHGTGKRMLEAAEAIASEYNAFGLYVSAPTGGRLERAAPLFGYARSHTVFFRPL